MKRFSTMVVLLFVSAQALGQLTASIGEAVVESVQPLYRHSRGMPAGPDQRAVQCRSANYQTMRTYRFSAGLRF